MPALEAVALEFGKSVLPAISRLASEYIEKAREYKEHDIRACEYYLEAARTAIDGLEAEYDQILVQAKHCDLGHPEQIKTLRERTDTYLKVDLLRPKLQDAVIGLGLCRKALQKSTEGFHLWFWPPLQERREDAIAEFDKLLQDLEKYLEDLNVHGLKDLRSGTGVGAQTLLEIETYLDCRPQGNIDPYGLARLVSTFQRDPSKDHLMDYIRRIRETTHHLRDAFR